MPLATRGATQENYLKSVNSFCGRMLVRTNRAVVDCVRICAVVDSMTSREKSASRIIDLAGRVVHHRTLLIL